MGDLVSPCRRRVRPTAILALTRLGDEVNEAKPFACPTCRTEYHVARVEAKVSTAEGQLLCTSCGGPLNAREGRFLLKYFGVGASRRSAPSAPCVIVTRLSRNAIRVQYSTSSGCPQQPSEASRAPRRGLSFGCVSWRHLLIMPASRQMNDKIPYGQHP
jgi:hypothetical protein